MRELEVANSGLDPRPGGRFVAGVLDTGGIVIPSTASAKGSWYTSVELAVSSSDLEGA
jgi:hypothetical protein